jgi:hypothetical protein
MRTLNQRHTFRSTSALLLAVALLLLPATQAFARSGSNDHVSFGGEITINDGETASDIACVFCTVHLNGDARGDIAVAFGSLTVGPSHTVSGDIAILGGDLTLADDVHVGGDVAVAAGDLNLAPTATISGSRTVFPGRFWLLIPLAPLLVIAGIIWLIVYLVRRNRYQFPVYPNGRRA